MRSPTLLLLLVFMGVTHANPMPMRILMLGNSYTAQTRGQVRGFLRADPKVDAELAAICPGGKTLAELVKHPQVTQKLEASGEWDVIILQEQSQLPAIAMTEDPKAVEAPDAGASVLIERIRNIQPQARIYLFETWARHPGPDKSNTLDAFDGKPETMQRALTAGYRHIQKTSGQSADGKPVTIIPVGQTFAAWYDLHGYEDPTLSLQRPDNSHPSKVGAFLTGAVIYNALTGRDPALLSYTGSLADPSLANQLKRLANTTSPTPP